MTFAGRSSGRWLIVLAVVLATVPLTNVVALAEDSSSMSVSITADTLAFHPDTVTIEAGRTVKMTLKNRGYVSHSFDIPELDIHAKTVNKNENLELSFRIDEPGRYAFICDVAQHVKAGMKGTIIVKEDLKD